MDDIVARLREHATDWNGEQMPDLEPAKCDPTAGMLRHAADAIESLRAENARLTEERDALVEVLYPFARAWKYWRDLKAAEPECEGALAGPKGFVIPSEFKTAHDMLDALAKTKGGPDAR